VTNEANADVLRHRGVPTIVLDDTPRTVVGRDRPPISGSRRVVVSASFDPDEPIEAVLGAAARTPDVQVVITGRDATGRTAALTVPANVELTGFVPRQAYEDLLAGATVVCSLTTLDDCMQQGGYEAMAWGRPLVTSDTAELRDYFGAAAVYAAPTAESIAAAWAEAIERATELHRQMVALGEAKVAGRPAELAPLRKLLGLDA
jgi:glycosyltransferase involved in cell wall biosynthesis